MKVKLIIISIILLLVMVFACGCIPFMEKLGLVNPTNEEQLSPEKGGSPDGLVKVLIGFKEKPGAAQQAMVKGLGGKIKYTYHLGLGGKIKYTYHLIPAIAASVPEVAIEALKKNPNITNVEFDSKVFALGQTLPWGVDRIDAEVVHDFGNNGAGIKIAIIDTGIDKDHPDLDANYAGGYDFVNSDDYPMDDNGHGTHVAGTVAAEDNNEGVVGVAPEASLYALKALNSEGVGYVSDVVYAIQWSTVNGIKVINMSLGGKRNIFLEWACNLAYYSDGLLLVAAAGNGGAVIYPAAYSSVIAVSATNSNDELAWFSSTGKQVELAAPGVSIDSTVLNGGYGEESGTSMSSPHVAGTAALVWAANLSWTNDIVRAQLRNTAEDLGAPGWDSEFGYGLVNAAEAAGVQLPPPNEPPTVSITSPVDGSIFDSGATILFEGTASDPEDENLTASLDWTSNIDGSIGTGGSFHETLSDGIHTITAGVTDSGGKTGSASIGITVGPPPEGVTVESIDPVSMDAGASIDVIITGAGFVNGIDVTFESGNGPAPTASTVVVVDAEKITATVTAKRGGPPRDRVWDVRVTNTDGSSGVLEGYFTVTP
jgi:hypothetical protein